MLLCKNNSMGNHISLYVLIKYCKSFLLLQVGFKDYVDTFLGCLVDGDILLMLTEDELQNSIGMMCKIARKRFVNHDLGMTCKIARKRFVNHELGMTCKIARKRFVDHELQS